jgi:energy-coupling factor transport system substrate-specific component
MLFIAKIKKPGMFSIMAVLMGIILFLFGRTWIPLMTCIIFGVIADLILRSGKYKSMKKSIVAAGVFNIWSIGMVFPVWFLGDAYNANLQENMPEGFVGTILSMKEPLIIALVIIGAFLMGAAGAFIGKAVMKKHFVKAGIV